MTEHKTVAFIGAGNMSGAIISGLLKNNFKPNQIWACSPTITEKSQYKNTQIHLTTDNLEAANQADCIVFGVKPHNIQHVCEELSPIIKRNRPLLISIAAGTLIDSIESFIGEKNIAIVRAMPNIAAAVTASATGLYANNLVTEEERIFAESLFRSVGTTLWAKQESQLNAITAISGSGPAYLFYVFEAMQQAAESLEIDKDDAKLLVAETAIGAAKMAIDSPEDFEKLRKLVTSPKGTTAAAIDVLMTQKVKERLIEAINAANLRAKELSQ